MCHTAENAIFLGEGDANRSTTPWKVAYWRHTGGKGAAMVDHTAESAIFLAEGEANQHCRPVLIAKPRIMNDKFLGVVKPIATPRNITSFLGVEKRKGS